MSSTGSPGHAEKFPLRGSRLVGGEAKRHGGLGLGPAPWERTLGNVPSPSLSPFTASPPHHPHRKHSQAGSYIRRASACFRAFRNGLCGFL